MILTLAVLAGLFAGLLRAWVYHRPLKIVQLHFTWLLVLAVLVQALFQVPGIGSRIPLDWIPYLQVGSLLGLLIYAGINFRKPGVWALGLGLLLNLSVITLNGGWMPISPQTAESLTHISHAGGWQIGQRFGNSKDLLRESDNTHLSGLSDRFLTPSWFPWHSAFSLGDLFIALGAFLLLYSLGAPGESKPNVG